MEVLTKRINDIDLLAEKSQVNGKLLRSRQTTYHKIMKIESRRIEDLKKNLGQSGL